MALQAKKTVQCFANGRFARYIDQREKKYVARSLQMIGEDGAETFCTAPAQRSRRSGSDPKVLILQERNKRICRLLHAGLSQSLGRQHPYFRIVISDGQ